MKFIEISTLVCIILLILCQTLSSAQPAPIPKWVKINGGREMTDSRSVQLSISAENAEEMFISGDVVEDDLTFKWIKFSPQVRITLTNGDGTKRVTVKLRRGETESIPLSASIILDRQGPIISSASVYDLNDPSDKDGKYHAGETLKIELKEMGDKAYFNGKVRISSNKNGYDTGWQELTSSGGTYTYIWVTDGIMEGDDYRISLVLEDPLGRKAGRSLAVTIDNTPPPIGSLLINGGAKYTSSRYITLSISCAADVTAILIEGDLERGLYVGSWMKPRNKVNLALSGGEGVKRISVKFQDAADNVSGPATEFIHLRLTPPPIRSVSVWNADNPLDNDTICRPGEKLMIEMRTDTELEGLNASISISSAKTKYSSGRRKMKDEGDGIYTFTWNTSKLKDGDDYQVKITLSDEVGHQSADESLRITVDSLPPRGAKVSLGRSKTASRTVKLNLSAQDAHEVFISGDVMDDNSTFRWIPFSKSLLVRLMEGDGRKKIEVKFKDKAGNETDPKVAYITLDTTPPLNPAISISPTLTSDRRIKLKLNAEGASEMLISGDITETEKTFKWIPFSKGIEVELTKGDGPKTVTAKFRDDVGNETDETRDAVTLDTTPPHILLLRSLDAANPLDSDNRYPIGTLVCIEIQSDEEGLEGNVRISSEKVSYQLSPQPLTDMGGGRYTFYWETFNLKPSEDYEVKAELTDRAGNTSRSDPLIISLSEKPALDKIIIDEGAEYTDSRLVSVKIVAANPAEMFIDGDIEDGDMVRKWVPFKNDLKLVLSKGDGLKKITVLFRNEKGERIGSARSSITLDRIPPRILSVEASPELQGATIGQREIFKAGDKVKITVKTDGETGLKGNLRITSKSTGYDSGQQSLTDEGDGSYSFTWFTDGLNEGRDYLVSVSLEDKAGHRAKDDTLSLTIDNTPPRDVDFDVAQGPRSAVRSVKLSFTAGDATEVLILGDLVPDSNVMRWIPVPDELVINLTPDDGEKEIKVKFRDKAGNETEFISKKVILDEKPPEILSLSTEDKREIYKPGDKVTFILRLKPEPDLIATIHISSQSVGYDSGEIEMKAGQDGNFTYTWDTTGLKEADDYSVQVKVTDPLSRESSSELKVALDGTPPLNPELTVNDGAQITAYREVTLQLKAEDANQIFISGDLVEDDNTFKWIPYTERLKVTLTKGDGDKLIYALFRDEAGNESEQVSSTIKLDTIGPSSISVRIKGNSSFTNSRKVRLELSADHASQIYIDGDVIREANTFRWIPYANEMEVRLTEGDGPKSIGVTFRSAEGNETPRIETEVTLDRTPPQISDLRSYDQNNPDDSDGIYHPGQIIVISLRSEHDLNCTFTLTGPAYDSGEQKVTDENGLYRFTWNTSNLKTGEYTAHVTLSDEAGNSTTDQITIKLDDTPPTNISVQIEGKSPFETPSIRLKISAQNASELFISGDVIDDTSTFQWIAYRENMTVNLSGRDGEKLISVRFRSPSGIESDSVDKNLRLEMYRPRLNQTVYIFKSPSGWGELLLPFDEDIVKVDRSKFNLTVYNPYLPGERVILDRNSGAISVERGRVLVKLRPQTAKSLFDLLSRAPRGVQLKADLSGECALDIASKGNLPAEGVNLILGKVRGLPLSKLSSDSFSPNGDGVKDRVSLSYSLPANAWVEISVLNTQGEKIKSLLDEIQTAGVTHTISWDGKDEKGEIVPEGVYRMEISAFDPVLNLILSLGEWEVMVDLTPPEIIDVSPPSGGSLVGGTQFQTDVRDPTPAPSGLEKVYLRWNLNQVPFSEVKFDPETGIHSLSTRPISLPVGEDELTLVAVDKAGNQNQLKLRYTVSASAEMKVMSYPNPVKYGSQMTIGYTLDRPIDSGTIMIFDSGGDLVFLKKMNGPDLMPNRSYEIKWDATDLHGETIPRGIYFCVLEVISGGEKMRRFHKIAVR